MVSRLEADAEAVEADRAHVAGRDPWPSRAPATPSPGALAPPAPTLGAASSVTTASAYGHGLGPERVPSVNLGGPGPREPLRRHGAALLGADGPYAGAERVGCSREP